MSVGQRPNVKRRITVAGAKDDRRDAYVLADSLSTDRHLFHRVRLDEAQVIRLDELSRMEEDLIQEQIRAGKQLRELLSRHYPKISAYRLELAEASQALAQRD